MRGNYRGKQGTNHKGNFKQTKNLFFILNVMGAIGRLSKRVTLPVLNFNKNLLAVVLRKK